MACVLWSIDGLWDWAISRAAPSAPVHAPAQFRRPHGRVDPPRLTAESPHLGEPLPRRRACGGRGLPGRGRGAGPGRARPRRGRRRAGRGGARGRRTGSRGAECRRAGRRTGGRGSGRRNGTGPGVGDRCAGLRLRVRQLLPGLGLHRWSGRLRECRRGALGCGRGRGRPGSRGLRGGRRGPLGQGDAAADEEGGEQGEHGTAGVHDGHAAARGRAGRTVRAATTATGERVAEGVRQAVTTSRKVYVRR